MSAWTESVEKRARLIHSEIAAWQTRARDLGLDSDIACAPFYDLLKIIYEEDLPLARARDNSDLLLHVEGKAVEHAPSISLVSGLFQNVKMQVRGLTRAIAGMLPDQKLARGDIDLGISGLARGSLYVGFTVPLPITKEGTPDLVGAVDPLFKATKEALQAINTVSHTIEVDQSEEFSSHQLAEVLPDPKIRDAALVAVRRISPSGRTGVDRIDVSAGYSDVRKPGYLTPEVRIQIGNLLRKPVASNEVVTFEGIVREIDLDAKRFELRRIVNAQIQDIRCIYAQIEIRNEKELLDSKVRVKGRIERRNDAAPRLLAIDEMKILGKARS